MSAIADDNVAESSVSRRIIWGGMSRDRLLGAARLSQGVSFGHSCEILCMCRKDGPTGAEMFYLLEPSRSCNSHPRIFGMTSQPIRVVLLASIRTKVSSALSRAQLSADFKLTAISHRGLVRPKPLPTSSACPLLSTRRIKLVNDQEVDLVVICVKVPEHLKLINSSECGESRPCEWPLSTDPESAMAIRDPGSRQVLAGRHRSSRTRAAPAINFVRDLLVDGHIGRVISSSFIGSGHRLGEIRCLSHLRTRWTLPLGAAWSTL